MTLIVGIVCSDGVVIAADRAALEKGDGAVRRRFLTDKILFDDRTPWCACAFSGQRASKVAADEIMRRCLKLGDKPPTQYEFEHMLKDVGNKAWKTASDPQNAEI